MQDEFDLSDQALDSFAFDEPTEIHEVMRTSDDVWNLRFLDMARQVARWSKDPKRKVGAIIVDWRNEVVALGYNGLPRSVIDTPHLLDDGERKNAFTIHAEVNACLKLASHITTGELRMYCTSTPCVDCMAIVAQAGISELFCPDDRRPDSKWARSWELALELAELAGMGVTWENEIHDRHGVSTR